MRLARPARWKRDAQSLTRRRDRLRESGDGLRESHRRTAFSGQRLRRGQEALKASEPQAIEAIVWTRKYPVRTPGKDRQASLGADLWRADRDQKSPVRRCFKSRPPLGGVRRFASGCRSSKGG